MGLKESKLRKTLIIAIVIAMLILAAGAATAKEAKDNKPLKIEATCGGDEDIHVFLTNVLSENVKTSVKATLYEDFTWNIDLNPGEVKEFKIQLPKVQDKEIEVHLNYLYKGKNFKEDVKVTDCEGVESQIPEFPTIILPIAAVIGLMVFFGRKKNKQN